MCTGGASAPPRRHEANRPSRKLASSSVFLGPFAPDCPFSIRQLNSSTYLVRENDKYHEYPHIYVKVVTRRDTLAASDASTSSRSSTPVACIVLSDTGCGTCVQDRESMKNRTRDMDMPAKGGIHGQGEYVREDRWTLGSFLEKTINPQLRFPYLIMLTHCHYDHILGLNSLPKTDAEGPFASGSHIVLASTVLASSHKKSFVVPKSHLAEHSLCNEIGVEVPKYNIGIWASDGLDVKYQFQDQNSGGWEVEIDTGITILQTPGHTPDSLTWYDRGERYIVVGDSLYDRESADTQEAPWGREQPMPTIFDVESDLIDWWDSLKKVLTFVRDRNEELEEDEEGQGQAPGGAEVCETAQDVLVAEIDEEWTMVSTRLAERKKRKSRVRLGAAHVTADVDAEECLMDMQEFMRRILREEVPWCSLGEERGAEQRLWDDGLGVEGKPGRFSVKAPLRVIEDGREAIPEGEWKKRAAPGPPRCSYLV